jgi:hypothetical protein
MKRLIVKAFLLVASFASCIRNDIPYPTVLAGITDLQVEGATGVTIDSDTHKVLITLEEATDMTKVNILSVTYNDSRVQASETIKGVHDLTSPLSVELRVYESTHWTIAAEQPIAREFTVTGQVGSTTMDAPNCRAIARVSKGTNLSGVSVTSLKLGPADITVYNPPITSLKDFSEPKKVSVKYHETVQEWTLYVEEVEENVSFDALDAWTCVAWLKASGVEGRENGFRLRKAGETEWSEVEGVTVSGTSFSAQADGLEPQTDYECVAYSGEEQTAVKTFTTQEARQMPNSGFETVSHAESSKYYSFYDPSSPDPELQTKWWGSGNKGSTTVGSSYAITLPDETNKVEGERSLKMMSRYVVVKFAAGNIFTGEFGRTIGASGGTVHMGRPFTLRPRKLTLYLKYQCGKIEEKTIGDVPEGEEVKVGDNDRASVWIALGDWDYRKYGGTADSPVEINTTDKSTFFDPKGENVIAYGCYIASESIDEWTKVEIPLEYVSTSRVPTHIIVSCAASMLGDYFTGSQNSILWVDKMELEY